MHDNCVVLIELETSAPFVLSQTMLLQCWHAPASSFGTNCHIAPCESHVMEWTSQASEDPKHLPRFMQISLAT